MFGVGDGLIAKCLEESGCEVLTIHPKYNPMFGGRSPEPIEENLEDLKRMVREHGADLGLATDGDADRAGIVDDQGRYLTPHQVFSLLLLYLVEGRGLDGGVAKTISLGYQPERIAEEFGLALDEVPVGFKYVSDKMREKDILLGGEESGGYGYRGHLLERDGILSCLLFVEMVARQERPLSRILEEMESRFGPSCFKRVDFEGAVVQKDRMTRVLAGSPVASLGGVKVSEVRTFDGVKYVLADGSWVLIRPSGTEPKVRVYAEAPSPAQLAKIVEEGIRIAKKAM